LLNEQNSEVMGVEGFTDKSDILVKTAMPGGIGPSKPLACITLHDMVLNEKVAEIKL